MCSIKICSYGGGVNSTAMIIGLTERKVILDVILFADTGGERPETYAFIDRFNKWLVMHRQPGITIVKKITKTGEVQTLEQDCLDKGTIPPIAFGYKTCSQKFKIAPQDKWCNNYEPIQKEWKEGRRVVKYIGFDAGEARRVRQQGDDKYDYSYPLIEWGWDRKACRQVIINAGLCLPPKSSCFFCPNMKKGEILALPDDLKGRAIAMERNSQSILTDIKGLGRSYKWEDLITADTQSQKLFDDLDMFQSPCECID